MPVGGIIRFKNKTYIYIVRNIYKYMFYFEDFIQVRLFVRTRLNLIETLLPNKRPRHV